MSDRVLIARFERELNLLMEEGQSFTHQDSPAEIQLVLRVAKICLDTNFADASQVRTKLLERLSVECNIIDVTSRCKLVGDPDDDNDVSLSEVVGGAATPSVGGCALCECSMSVDSISGERCPTCGHDRHLHR